MALLGAQLVITLIFVSLIQKLSPHFSLAKWILCSTGLLRYLHPTDDELRQLAGVPKEKSGRGKDKRNGYTHTEKSSSFHIPRCLDIQLETTKITHYDVLHLRYFTEYQWLIDFSLYAAIVYCISETYHFFVPIKDEVNLSMLWCLLVIFFAFKLLASLTIQYFKSDESIGERSTCIVTGFIYLLIAMIAVILPERILEVGLNTAYDKFNEGAGKFLAEQGVSNSGPASKIVLLFFIAVCCGIIGAIFTFPGLRMAKMHFDSLKYCKDRKLLKIILNINFAMPFLLVLLWVKPVSRDYLTTRIFSGMEKPLMESEMFEAMRLYAIIFAVILRICLMPIYLQAYLNLAFDRVEDQKKEAGRITNTEFQRKITSIFYYLCVVTLQYAAPILMCLFLSFMYKTLGGYSWSWKTNILVAEECSADLDDLIPATTTETPQVTEPIEPSIVQVAESFHLSLQNLKSVFTEEVYRGVLGFATWWTVFVWFASSSLGMFYQTYFTNKT
ncbi:CLUMA_CG011941, isoform A [Clunio marinus]|uniref:CLUMA_CG011941, isoform A n=1 Tax=Clunio marinus TaxID=568069 RepID=A0A1J1IEY0_9DIPT|nr:CLUMA_CG011941, isoform A [Clunio marinus]